MTTRPAASETGDPLLLTPGPLTTSARVKQAMVHRAARKSCVSTAWCSTGSFGALAIDAREIRYDALAAVREVLDEMCVSNGAPALTAE